jgi:hypothetical protein
MIPTIRRAMAYFNATVPTFGEMTLVELREQQIARQRCRSQPTCERADAGRSPEVARSEMAWRLRSA